MNQTGGGTRGRKPAVFGRLSALCAHTKAPYKMDSHRKTLRALNCPGRARTVVGGGLVVVREPPLERAEELVRRPEAVLVADAVAVVGVDCHNVGPAAAVRVHVAVPVVVVRRHAVGAAHHVDAGLGIRVLVLLDLAALDAALRADEGGLSFVAGVCCPYRDSPYKRERGEV